MSRAKLISVWLVLMFLTVLSSILASNMLVASAVTSGILFVAMLKFIGVSFFFMEIHKAHIFWKLLILFYILFFITLITII